MKLLIDMNLSPQWVRYFISNNIEACHWSVIGEADDSDIEIMEYAKNHDYTIFTHDLDFGTILATTKTDKPSAYGIRIEYVHTHNYQEETAVRQIHQGIQQLPG